MKRSPGGRNWAKHDKLAGWFLLPVCEWDAVRVRWIRCRSVNNAPICVGSEPKCVYSSASKAVGWPGTPSKNGSRSIISPSAFPNGQFFEASHCWPRYSFVPFALHAISTLQRWQRRPKREKRKLLMITSMAHWKALQKKPYKYIACHIFCAPFIVRRIP